MHLVKKGLWKILTEILVNLSYSSQKMTIMWLGLQVKGWYFLLFMKKSAGFFLALAFRSGFSCHKSADPPGFSYEIPWARVPPLFKSLIFFSLCLSCCSITDSITRCNFLIWCFTLKRRNSSLDFFSSALRKKSLKVWRIVVVLVVRTTKQK